MLWINFLHCYQPANSDSYKISEAADDSYKRIVSALLKNPSAKFTLNISACLLDRLSELKHFSLLEKIEQLIENGQIELVGSAAYHALLPLVSDNEIIWQIKENERIIKKYFPNIKLKGFFLPEMAYSPRVAKIIKSLKYSWIILDEISYQGSKKINFNKIYKDKQSGLNVIFRSRKYSNCYPPDEIYNNLNKLKKDDIVISASDGELYGLRHRDFSGKLEKVLSEKKVKTITISKYISKFKKIDNILLRKSNWESSEKNLIEKKPYHLWYDKDNEIHLRLWELVNLSLYFMNKYKKDANYNWARWHISRGLASCTFWWASANDFKHNFGPHAWSPDEIERGSDEMIRAIRSLENSTSKSEKIKSEELFINLKKIIWTKHWTSYFKNTNNKINKLLDDKFVLRFFNKNILPLYPDFNKIEKIKIISHKKYIWQTTYHVVLEFKVSFFLRNIKNKTKKNSLSFFCTAHSSEPRKNVHETLKYLWENGFARGFLTIPKPLFYSKYFNASFYRGVNGDSLLEYIKKDDRKELEKMVKKMAEWLAKLHKTPVSSSFKFNKKNSKIKTVIPGYNQVIKEVQAKYKGKYVDDLKKIYDFLIDLEDDFFSLSSKKWLIHGDAHPDNVIKMGTKKIAMIDFADICTSDFARDLGTFLQQLEYKLKKYNYEKSYIDDIKSLFINTYCQKAKIKYNIRIKERVNLYYNWTALRTATFWLLKHDPKPERAKPLISDIKRKLKIK